jgi:glycosyltransferase involved in cell wall biosynthesis
MRIVVFNVPAESGGALTILHDFYREATEHYNKKIEWIFVVSKPELQVEENITVLRFPWIKKSWWHRLLFDHLVAPKLVKKYKVDKVLSLQNTIIPRVRCNQTVYIQQALPFVKYKYKWRENKLLWIYQNVIGRKIINSIKKSDQVIVQTKWMKEACVEKTNVNEKKITVVPPNIKVPNIAFFEPKNMPLPSFFYPATGLVYKNHSIIVEACKQLVRSTNDFKVVFTLDGDENPYISNLTKQAIKEQLPIEYIGTLSKEEVYKFYTQSILLFPSFIETFGLPLLEARLHNGIILAADCPFSREILGDYENAYFFNPFNVQELVLLMEQVVTGKILHINRTNALAEIGRKSITDLLSK